MRPRRFAAVSPWGEGCISAIPISAYGRSRPPQKGKDLWTGPVRQNLLRCTWTGKEPNEIGRTGPKRPPPEWNDFRRADIETVSG